jgi:Domain of unknown function (DUF6378)
MSKKPEKSASAKKRATPKPFTRAEATMEEHMATEHESINMEAERIINGPRRDEYGPAKESFDKIATGWEVIFGVNMTSHQVALAMIWLKTCRALNGYQRDSFVDICGYAGLAEVISEA